MHQIISKLIPVPIKEAIKHISFHERRSARHLAAKSKRLDICSPQIAHLMHLSSIGSIEGMECLEIGSGWVLSHALVFYLLGAKRIIATDLMPHAHPSVLIDAIRYSVASLPRDILAPFSDHYRIRKRMDRLLAINKYSFDTLKQIGIEYISPIDLARQKISIKVNLIYSISVLEHVPCNDVPLLLANLAEMLSPGGSMLHAIHLEDHLDHNNPFNFLSISENAYDHHKQTTRGNRIRASEWTLLFNTIPKTTTKFIYNYHRYDCPLPKKIDISVHHSGNDDLKISHIGMFSKKSQS